MKTRLFGLLLLVSFTVLVTGEYNSYGRQPSSSSFGAVYNDTHESRSAKRYINNDNPIPGDLLDNLVVDGFNRPVNIEFAPDGRIFVAEKAGVIKIVNADGTVQAEPWIDISRKVHDAADRGMLGMVLDPNFAVNKWVYVLYVRNPQEGVPNINANVASIGVIARYYDTPNGRADVGSEQILLGDGLNNGFPCCSNSHLVGDLAFGLDGTLFASAGDGARWEWVDDGSNRTPEDATCEQLFPNDDIGAFRAQSLDSLGGKIIRINKENGNGIGPENGLVANPMYDAANPKSIRSRIWVWGLRNPYRIHVRKDSNVGPGSIYISDVGFYDWEEFNLVREPGVNFGWPCVVADEIVDPEYNNAVANPIAAARCREILQLPRKSPLIYYNHWTPDWAGFTGNSPVGTAIYYGDSYPDRYTGDSTDRAVFCADFGYERWIRVFWVDENDNFKPEKGIQYLAGGIGPIVGLKSNPFTGDIYYWLLGGQIRRFVPADRPVINTPPRVYLAANPSSGNVALNGPLTVSFSSYGTFDQERNKFTMLWDFGDGSTSYEANPTHVYTTSGEFTVTLSVTDDEGLVGTKTMIVRTNNIAPTVRITSPVDNFVFPTETGTRTPFRATVTDPDTPGTGLNYRWEFRVVHNNHFHMDEFVTFDREFDFDLAVGVSALERNMLEIFLVVTDEAGNTAQDMIRVRPAGMTNGGPTAVLAVTPLTGDVLHNIALDATGSIDPDQDMLHIIWDFGDGSVISTYADMRTFYTYSRPGTYQVKVTVVDVFAVESESAPITVTVTGEPVPTSTGPLTTGPATTGPATTGAATTGPDATGPATSAPGSTGAETTASVTSGPDTTSGGNTGVTTTAPGTTSDPASTSNPSETTTASSTTESASTEGPVTTGSEITTGEEPNETTVGTTDKEPEVTTTSNSNNRQSSASSITMSFVVISISLIFVALL